METKWDREEKKDKRVTISGKALVSPWSCRELHSLNDVSVSSLEAKDLDIHYRAAVTHCQRLPQEEIPRHCRHLGRVPKDGFLKKGAGISCEACKVGGWEPRPKKQGTKVIWGSHWKCPLQLGTTQMVPDGRLWHHTSPYHHSLTHTFKKIMPQVLCARHCWWHSIDEIWGLPNPVEKKLTSGKHRNISEISS